MVNTLHRGLFPDGDRLRTFVCYLSTFCGRAADVTSWAAPWNNKTKWRPRSERVALLSTVESTSWCVWFLICSSLRSVASPGRFNGYTPKTRTPLRLDGPQVPPETPQLTNDRRRCMCRKRRHFAVDLCAASTPTQVGKPAPCAPEEEPYEPLCAPLSRYPAPQVGKIRLLRSV